MQALISRFVIAVVLLFLVQSASRAQTTSAALSGVVTDQAGALILNATVTATDTGTNLRRATTTNGEGFYTLSPLPVGVYEVKMSASGFEVLTFPSVVINVGQNVALDGQLCVGGTTVVLDGESSWMGPSIDRESTRVDAVIGSREIGNLPLNGRNYLELALLTPGNAPAPNFDPTKANTVLISSAGQLGRGGNVMLDGTDNNDDMVGGSLVNVSQDAVQEFQVTTNRFSAEFGRSGSSIINVVTKGGTNELRGSFSFFHRDKALQGLPATFDRSQPTPPFDRQQYAFTLGGPIVKDKLFAFGAFEYRDQDGAVLVGRREVPTRTIIREFFPAPSNDVLFNSRFDYLPSDHDRLNFRYSVEDVKHTNSSRLDREIG